MAPVQAPVEKFESASQLRLTVVGLGFSAVLLLGSLLALFYLAHNYEKSSEWVSHTHQVISKTRNYLAQLLDVETGVRGYLITGKKEFLEPYYASKSLLVNQIVALKRFTADNAVQTPRFERLGILGNDERRVLESLIESKRSKASIEHFDAGILRSKEILDESRDLISKIEVEETRLLDIRRRRAKDNQRLLFVSLVLAGTLSLLTLYMVAHLLRRYFLDITAYTNKLRQSTVALERSNAELQQFAYIASHDLQEPLRAVAGFLTLISRKYKGHFDEQSDQWIEFAVDGARRMQMLIDDILNLSRVDTRGEPMKPVESSEILKMVESNLAVAIAESNANIETLALPKVNGDSNQLLQLFQNLLANGIKFRSELSPVLRVSAIQDAVNPNMYQFAVQDNGIGFDMEHAERIFMVFQRLQTRSKYPGTGIGLAICKKIVERHGGKIWVESAPGSGSTFFFTLPIAR
jgi:signal transduction histidine kinase